MASALLNRRYTSALRAFLRRKSAGVAVSAVRLGREAVAAGLDTLDVARMHDVALLALRQAGATAASTTAMRRRARRFFADACTPIEATHRPALEASRDLRAATAALALRTSGLAASQKSVKRGIARRKTAEDNLRKSAEQDAKLIGQSHQLQQELRVLAHRIITAQEESKRKMSRELRDCFAQTLVGINVRLETLRASSVSHALDFQKELASTQRLVGESTKLMAPYSHAP